MDFPWVSRVKLEALEDKYDELEKRYRELELHADKLLESLLERSAGKIAEEEKQPERKPLPRRLLNREISALASQAAEIRYQNSRKT